MSFLAGYRLWLLLLVVALGVAYVIIQRQRRQYAVRFTNVDLLASVAPRRPGWRRHLAAACLLIALTLIVGAFARPARAIQVPRETATVMLAIDVSQSMRATDVEPTRLRAAQRAVRAFVDSLPTRFRLGLVAFAGNAQVLVPPTHQRALVRQAVTNLQLQQQTAIGEAIFASIGAMAIRSFSGCFSTSNFVCPVPTTQIVAVVTPPLTPLTFWSRTDSGVNETGPTSRPTSTS